MGMTTQASAYLRRVANSFLTDSCTILRPSATITAEGYPDVSLGTAGTAIACRITPWDRTPDREGEIALQERGKEFYFLYLKYDQSIQSGDKIQENGVTYEVVHIDTAHTDIVTRRAQIVRMP